jgi:hypothetical protein
MRRRSRASSEPTKARRSKAEMPKRRNATTARHSSSSASGQETEVARLARERNEALEQLSEALKQQTAASEVLRLISGSPANSGRSLTPCSSMQRGFAKPGSAFCFYGRKMLSAPWHCTTRRQRLPNSDGVNR